MNEYTTLLDFVKEKVVSVAPNVNVFTAYDVVSAAKQVTEYPSIAIVSLPTDYTGEYNAFPFIKSHGFAWFGVAVFVENAENVGAGRDQAFDYMKSIRQILVGKFPPIFSSGFPIVIRREELDSALGTITIGLSSFSVRIQVS